MTAAPALSMHDVNFRYGDVDILRSFTFTLQPGLVTGIIGPNGAGKSTLLGILAGDITPTSGTVFCGDTPLGSMSYKERARVRAVMLQDVNVAFSYLVRDIVDMGRSPWTATDEDPAIIDRALRAADIVHLEDRDILSLSGGERARVAFARVLAQTTPIMLLDEPTAALDIAHQEQLLHVVRERAQRGAAVGVIVHDLSLAAAYCDYLVLLDHGELRAEGIPGEVLTPAILSDVYDCPISVLMTEQGLIVVPTR